MNIAIKPTLSAVWSTDAHGICIASLESPEGLMPLLKGITLCEWLSLALVEEDAKIAMQLTAALEFKTPFNIEVPIKCLDGTMRHVIVAGLPACQPGDAHA